MLLLVASPELTLGYERRPLHGQPARCPSAAIPCLGRPAAGRGGTPAHQPRSRMQAHAKLGGGSRIDSTLCQIGMIPFHARQREAEWGVTPFFFPNQLPVLMEVKLSLPVQLLEVVLVFLAVGSFAALKPACLASSSVMNLPCLVVP